nr:putative transposase (putative), gypsy type [Tanacetum cinerariifolium]
MDLLSFTCTTDPTKVRIGERQREEDEPKLLETTVERVVPLLPVAPDRSFGELKASVEKLFSEGKSGEQAKQGDSASGDHDVGIDVLAETSVEGVAPAQLKRQKKQKTKLLMPSSIQRLLDGAMQNAEVKGGVIPNLPFVSSSVSTTPAREGGDHTELLAGANLRAIGAPQRFVISSDSSDHSGVNIAEAEVDSVVRTSVPIIMIATTTTTTPTVDPAAIAKEKLVGSSVFGEDSHSADGSDPLLGGFFDCSGSDFLIGGIRTVIEPDSNLQKVYVPQWNATNRFCVDDSGVCREMVDEFAPLKFFASVREMDHDQLFTEFNVRAARQISLSAEVKMRAEYNIKERRRLNYVVEEKDSLLKSRCEEIKSLKAQLLVKEMKATEAVHLRAEASKFAIVEKSLRDETQVLKERNATLEKEKNLDVVVTSVKLHNDSLADQVHKLEASFVGLQEKVTVYEDCMSQLEKFQDEKMEEVNEKFDKLCADFLDMALHLEEKFYPYLLTTISRRQWLLTHDMELAIAKCLNSTKYLCALGATIGKAIEKGMQEGLSAGITHGAEGRKLTDVAAYNPSAETDYLSALQRLQSVNFSLITELKANKDASVETIMNLLRLEDALAEKLGFVK